MKAYLAEGSAREQVVTGMELEAMVLEYITAPSYKTFETITKGMMDYNKLWNENHS